jgi:type IV pilus assembly protein PilM
MSDSIWKKEISLKRKPKSYDPAEQVDEPPKQSVWKKEISLSRKKRDREVERLVEAAVEAVSPTFAEPAPLAPPPPPPPPVALAEAVVAAMPPAHEPEPSAVEPPAPVAPVHEYTGLAPEILAASADAPQPVVEQPAAAWPEPQPDVVAPEPAETWSAAPELPLAVEPERHVVLHPPVSAAELPPLPAAPAQAPFWKKELSFSRKPRAPKPTKEPKAPKASAAPFWKKELSFGKKKATPAADAVTEQLPVAKTPGAPFRKKQLSLSLPKLSLSVRGGSSSKRVVGLKIGASQLAAARVSNNGVAELQQLARDPLAPGVVVAGELRDPDALGEALKLFFARHKLPRKGVRLGIASNRIGVRIFDIVGIDDDKQLANAVQFRAQEALPIPLDEAVLDYRVLGASVDESGQAVKRVLLVVAYRELVERYFEACRKAGIALAGVDLEAFALLRALGAPTDRGASALVGVAIGHDRSTFAVSDGRVCEFTRVVEWGGSALNVALARVFDCTPSEAEGIKRSLSLDGEAESDDLTPEQTAAALDAVRRQVQSFARELVSSLQFYQNQPGSLGIGEVVLTGGTAHLPGLAAELERLIGVRVRVGDPLARLKVSKRIGAPEQVGSLAVAIGLGIED